MFRQIKYPLPTDYARLCERPALEQAALGSLIEGVFQKVQSEGDAALRELTRNYENREIDSILYTQTEIDELADKTEESAESD
jgi:histidinol dehydrogenase